MSTARETLRLALVPIATITPAPWNPRTRADDLAELDTLKASLLEQGLIEPLVVRPVAGVADAFELLAGHRRLRALVELDAAGTLPPSLADGVPCAVRDDLENDLTGAQLVALAENAQRRDLDFFELAEALAAQVAAAKARGERGIIRRLATALGRGERSIEQLVKIAHDLVPALAERARAGTITLEQARVIASLEPVAQNLLTTVPADAFTWRTAAAKDLARSLSSGLPAFPVDDPDPTRAEDAEGLATFEFVDYGGERSRAVVEKDEYLLRRKARLSQRLEHDPSLALARPGSHAYSALELAAPPPAGATAALRLEASGAIRTLPLPTTNKVEVTVARPPATADFRAVAQARRAQALRRTIAGSVRLAKELSVATWLGTSWTSAKLTHIDSYGSNVFERVLASEDLAGGRGPEADPNDEDETAENQNDDGTPAPSQDLADDEHDTAFAAELLGRAQLPEMFRAAALDWLVAIRHYGPRAEAELALWSALHALTDPELDRALAVACALAAPFDRPAPADFCGDPALVVTIAGAYNVQPSATLDERLLKGLRKERLLELLRGLESETTLDETATGATLRAALQDAAPAGWILPELRCHREHGATKATRDHQVDRLDKTTSKTAKTANKKGNKP